MSFLASGAGIKGPDPWMQRRGVSVEEWLVLLREVREGIEEEVTAEA